MTNCIVCGSRPRWYRCEMPPAPRTPSTFNSGTSASVSRRCTHASWTHAPTCSHVSSASTCALTSWSSYCTTCLPLCRLITTPSNQRRSPPHQILMRSPSCRYSSPMVASMAAAGWAPAHLQTRQSQLVGCRQQQTREAALTWFGDAIDRRDEDLALWKQACEHLARGELVCVVLLLQHDNRHVRVVVDDCAGAPWSRRGPKVRHDCHRVAFLRLPIHRRIQLDAQRHCDGGVPN